MTKRIELPRIHNTQGNMAIIESPVFPFPIKRVYYLYDVPSGTERGGHAHKKIHELLIAVSGSFDVTLNREEVVRLDRPWLGLHLKPMTWRELSNFSTNSVCLVIASEHYDESDYLRDYEDFKSLSTQDTQN